MTKRLLLVDLGNVHEIDLSLIDVIYRMTITVMGQAEPAHGRIEEDDGKC